MLADGDRKSNEMFDACVNAGVTVSTINYTKRQLGVQSIIKDNDWYWTIDPDAINAGREKDETPVNFLDEISTLQTIAAPTGYEAQNTAECEFSTVNNFDDLSTIKMMSPFGEIKLLDWRHCVV